MVDDPSEYVDVLLSDPAKSRAARRELKKRRAKGGQTDSGTPTAADQLALAEVAAELERERLFGILRELVKWENTTNEELLEQARGEIWLSWRRTCAENADHPQAKELFDRHKLPAFHDPFAGGGALPLEAQRLGLEAHASDLNPVAVLICKAMLEIPPKFAAWPPVNPESKSDSTLVASQWSGAQGLAEDVRYYGRWMREEAQKRIGHLYPQVEITSEVVQERPDLVQYQGRRLNVIAWLWARTVRSPNPAYADEEVPLVSTFMLSTKKGKEAYVDPMIEGRGYRFAVKAGLPADRETTKSGTKLSRGTFRCLMSGTPIGGDHIKAEGQAGRMGARLMAVVAEGDRGRVYLKPMGEHVGAPAKARPAWIPEGDVPARLTGGTCVPYGLTTWADLFTPRQLVALTTFSDLVGEATERVRLDAAAAGLPNDGRPLRDGGTGATAYAEAVGVYLGVALSRLSDICNALCRWEVTKTQVRNLFGRQAIPMIWDFAENNVFGGFAGDYMVSLENMVKALERLPSSGRGSAKQGSAQASSLFGGPARTISTDPPYYDNIGYADLSDFFYVWLRRSLGPIFPDLFSTMAVPKVEELIASPYRHGGKQQAEEFFLDGMTQAMKRLVEQAHPSSPVTIYYAFKQSETKRETGTVSTGWETFLDAVMRSGFAITGTWPVRTELLNKIGMGANLLASSIVLVCRPRPADAPLATRRELLAALRAELPRALRLLQSGNVAPVDLAQAAIGPGMAVYTRYALSRSGERFAASPRGERPRFQPVGVADREASPRWRVGRGGVRVVPFYRASGRATVSGRVVGRKLRRSPSGNCRVHEFKALRVATRRRPTGSASAARRDSLLAAAGERAAGVGNMVGCRPLANRPTRADYTQRQERARSSHSLAG